LKNKRKEGVDENKCGGRERLVHYICMPGKRKERKK
jgi:hypothetical protein